MSREELIKARERVVRQFTLWERCYRKKPDRQHKNVMVTVDNTALRISGVVKRTAGKYKPKLYLDNGTVCIFDLSDISAIKDIVFEKYHGLMYHITVRYVNGECSIIRIACGGVFNDGE